MSFDRPTRNALARMVGHARERLRADVMDQLRRLGFQADGTVLDLDRIAGLSDGERAAALELRALLDHFMALESGPETARRQAGYDRLVREIGFTTFNRLAALRMAEERGLIVQSVGRGFASDGFQIYERVANGALGSRVETYRAYLECLYDELAQDLPLLFERGAPESSIFPGERCLEEVLGLLNDPNLAHLWREDEAIGWVYQYYNDPDERRRMREASQAPRNSRELAVRNQFFTPRYVVEFLTDNTLGRMWYEMRQGNTRLKEQCRYLVIRPNEIFLRRGEQLPATDEPAGDLNREELLRSPVYVPYRAKKDPRDLKVLDPACGSGHFLLYAFDLLESIYEEAWADPESPPSETTGRTLREDYPDLKSLRCQVPELILRHNLYGVDIDSRACQIAALALWLRAQRSYQNLGLRQAERPPLTKGNIVVAEPMPGERDLLEQFVARLDPPLVGGLVKLVFNHMQLAGEVGSLLKIEEELRDAIRSAKAIWQRAPRAQQLALLHEFERRRAEQLSLFDLSGITDEVFWEQVEQRVFEVLEAYVSAATNGTSTQRRLFAEDALRGFAFIDICRRRYDVVLMNPPFGEPSHLGSTYIDSRYPHSAGDIFQAFVEAMLSSTREGGRIGVISARTGFFLGNSENWRRNVVFQNRLTCFVDLGLGVLDAALVEVAAYVIERGTPDGRQIFVNRQLSTRDKEPGLTDAVRPLHTRLNPDTFLIDQGTMAKVPGCVFAYWAPARLLRRYGTTESFGSVVARVRQGLATGDDFRFVRLGWEIPVSHIGRQERWQRFSKGGEYSPFFDDIHLVVDWIKDGCHLACYSGSRFQNTSFYFLPGATYTVRTASALAAKVLPAECVFSHNAQSWFTDSSDRCLLSIAFLSCRVPQAFLELAVGAGDIATAGSAARRYTTAVVESVPAGPIEHLSSARSLSLARQLLEHRIGEFSRLEVSGLFKDFATAARGKDLSDMAYKASAEIMDGNVRALELSKELDDAVSAAFALGDEELSFIDTEVGPHPCSYTKTPDESEVLRLLSYSVEELMRAGIERRGSKRWLTKKSYFVERHLEIASHILEASPRTLAEMAKDRGIVLDRRGFAESVMSECVGFAFGRWDARLALDPTLAPKLPDPFDPLPVCPPGTLVGPDGLPAEAGRIVSEEWLRARPNAITLPSEGSVLRPTIADEEYPLLVSWDGVLVDDPQHPDDIVRRVQEVLALLWPDRADAIEQEACEILGVSSLRDYFRRPAGSFADHLRRYSKSRRQAPIYWPLSTASGSYTLWVYYHRLTSDTLYTAVNRYVEPKIASVERELREAEGKLAAASGRIATRLREQVESSRAFLTELRDFRDELLRVAALPYRPNLDDGVIINAAPLHKLFRLPKWARDTRETWARLERGDYDWAHLAYTIWPERVREKCRSDRSLAIAHNLEHLYVAPRTTSRQARRRPARAGVER